MKILEPVFIKVLKELIMQGLFFIDCGYAVNYYGYGRATGDIDFWLRPDNENKNVLITAFKNLKMNNEDIIEIDKLDFTQAQVFFIGEVPLRIDFLTKVNIVNLTRPGKKEITFL
jgi:hypothetical protein